MLDTQEQARGVDKVKRYKWTVSDRKGSFRYISKQRLEVDPQYQRTVNDKKALQLASNWSWVSCGSLTVAERHGRFFIIDGQHRWSAAMRRSDILDLPCMVFQTKDTVEEAAGFLATNTHRKPITSLDRFRAEIHTGDDQATVVLELLNQVGREAGARGSSAATACISTMKQLVRWNEPALRRVWPLVDELCQGRGIHSKLLSGLWYVEANAANGFSLVDPKWRKRAIKSGHDGLLAAAQSSAAFHKKGGAKQYAIGMLNALNHGVQHRFLLKAE